MSRVYRVQCRTWPVAPSYVAGVRHNVVDTWVLIPEKIHVPCFVLYDRGGIVIETVVSDHGGAGPGCGLD